MRKLAFLLSILLLLCMLAGCAADTPKDTALPDNTNEKASKATGIFQGLADNNSYELKLAENTYKVFQITEDVRDEFEKLNLAKGDKVDVTYQVSPSSILQTVGIALANEASEATVTGKYIGLSDNNFFEVLLDDENKDDYKVFMITDDIRPVFEKLELQKDEPVRIQYKSNSVGQLEVMNIEKTGKAKNENAKSSEKPSVEPSEKASVKPSEQPSVKPSGKPS